METPRYRIGNDLSVFWSITNRDGSPYDFENKEIRLYVTNDRGRKEVTPILADLGDGTTNNVIHWDFKGSEQRVLGKHTLTVEILESDTHREITKDYCEAFVLVGRSEMEDAEGDANISVGGNLILASKLDIYRFEAVDVDVSELKIQIYEVEKNVETLSGKLDDKADKADIEELEDALSLAGKEISDIKTKSESTDETIGSLNEKDTLQDREIETVKEDLEPIKAWYRKLQPHLDIIGNDTLQTDLNFSSTKEISAGGAGTEMEGEGGGPT